MVFSPPGKEEEKRWIMGIKGKELPLISLLMASDNLLPLRVLELLVMNGEK